MGYVKSKPVTALRIDDKDAFLEQRMPGSFRLVPDGDGEWLFWYCCPCGCRNVGPLTVGENFKPADGPSWRWNGSLDAPTLEPSVHHRGHWHGWLRNGVWESC